MFRSKMGSTDFVASSAASKNIRLKDLGHFKKAGVTGEEIRNQTSQVICFIALRREKYAHTIDGATEYGNGVRIIHALSVYFE
jgi:hypothetical protein